MIYLCKYLFTYLEITIKYPLVGLLNFYIIHTSLHSFTHLYTLSQIFTLNHTHLHSLHISTLFHKYLHYFTHLYTPPYISYTHLYTILHTSTLFHTSLHYFTHIYTISHISTLFYTPLHYFTHLYTLYTPLHYFTHLYTGARNRVALEFSP